MSDNDADDDGRLTLSRIAPLLGGRADPSVHLVTGGARAAGGIADAVVRLDVTEHQRRAAVALEGVTSLDALDALMCLPLDVEVRVRDLDARRLTTLRAAPNGCLEWLDDGRRVRRLITPAVEVTLVVVQCTAWAQGVRRAAVFAPFATRTLLVERLPRSWPASALDAVAAGVGVWAADVDGQLQEHLPAAPFVQRWAKPARWRFVERAYQALCRSTTLDPSASMRLSR